MLLLLCFSGGVSAQSPADSAALANASWRTVYDADGMTVRKLSIRLFDSDQQISCIEIAPEKYRLAVIQDSLRTKTSRIGKQSDAVAAINGGFFKTRTKQAVAMGFIKLLIGLPLVVVILVFAFVNNDLATFNLWPFYVEITVSQSVAIVSFVVFGYILGKVSSWMSYAPVRAQLRKQKKENKKLNKEQQKLTEKVSGLQENLETLKTQTAEILPPKPTLKDMMKNIFKRKEKETL